MRILDDVASYDGVVALTVDIDPPRDYTVLTTTGSTVKVREYDEKLGAGVGPKLKIELADIRALHVY